MDVHIRTHAFKTWLKETLMNQFSATIGNAKHHDARINRNGEH